VNPAGQPPATAAADPAVDALREQIMADAIGFGDVLERLECRIAGDAIEYLAHWITPERSPRRFDTRFFAARVSGAATPIVDAREMTDALWVTPTRAVRETDRGNLHMILPTVRTLERLAGYMTTADALAALGRARVPTILPKLVVTPSGERRPTTGDE
jgi:hypothetical protein